MTDPKTSGPRDLYPSKPRSIETIDDVRAVLNSPRASAAELLDCAQIASSSRERQLQEDAAERLLGALRNNKRHTDLQVKEAAEHVVAAWTADASRLEELSDYLRRAKAWLGELREDDRLKTMRTEDLLKLVSSTLLLIPPNDDQSRIELSSRLRKLKNSELAIHVVRPVAARDPNNVYAATAYSAALIDTDKAHQAVRVLNELLRKTPNEVGALVTLSRAQSSLGLFNDSHQTALNAFRLQQNDFSAHRLLASAAEVEDSSAFEDALQFVEESLVAAQSTLSQNVLLLAAEELVRTEPGVSAEKAVRKLLELRWKGSYAKRVGALRRWLLARDQLTLEIEAGENSGSKSSGTSTPP